MMIWLIQFFISAGSTVAAQDDAFDQQLETFAESHEEDTEDEYNSQQLQFYRSHPANLNGDFESLNNFPLLNIAQVNQLMAYRKILGDLVSIYELQAVPGFTIRLIREIFPYVTVTDAGDQWKALAKRWKGGRQTMALRPTLIPEKQKGFQSTDSSSKAFQGSRPRYFFRYRYQYKDLLQYGITGDKDAGENFGFDSGRFGFDFYSYHLFIRRTGIIKSLALGDYSVNLGQGLIQWQSQAFNKSSAAISIKRQAEMLRPYHSAGEFNFNRGIGITIGRKHWDLTVFGSSKKISANLSDDAVMGTVISSVISSGLFRTQAEEADRNNASLKSYGISARWLSGASMLGLNWVGSQYSIPLLKRDEPYNLYSIKGRTWSNGSLNFSHSIHNFHFFGEIAADRHQKPALLAGVLSTLSPFMDFSCLIRAIHKEYQSVYGNAFTENTMPTNERGIYLGFSFRPFNRFTLDMYLDHFEFPWIRYRAGAPGWGNEFLLQAEWKPGRTTQVYTRFRYRIKPMDEDQENSHEKWTPDHQLINWRIHYSIQPYPRFMVRGRIEYSMYNFQGNTYPEQGFLIYQDIHYKPFGKSWSASFRMHFFDCDSYNTRLYAYENDVLFAAGIPMFYGKGRRVYLNLAWKPRINFVKYIDCNLGLKLGVYHYTDREVVGSGMDEIGGAYKSEIRFQVCLTGK